jgi:hypothetical protein
VAQLIAPQPVAPTRTPTPSRTPTAPPPTPTPVVLEPLVSEDLGLTFNAPAGWRLVSAPDLPEADRPKCSCTGPAGRRSPGYAISPGAGHPADRPTGWRYPADSPEIFCVIFWKRGCYYTAVILLRAYMFSGGRRDSGLQLPDDQLKAALAPPEASYLLLNETPCSRWCVINESTNHHADAAPPTHPGPPTPATTYRPSGSVLHVTPLTQETATPVPTPRHRPHHRDMLPVSHPPAALRPRHPVVQDLWLWTQRASPTRWMRPPLSDPALGSLG